MGCTQRESRHALTTIPGEVQPATVLEDPVPHDRIRGRHVVRMRRASLSRSGLGPPALGIVRRWILRSLRSPHVFHSP